MDNDHNHLPYNTKLKKLVLPEYCRNIQNMVDYCMTLEDKDERTRCAHAIVRSMEILFPTQKGEDGESCKFWDHLALMSNFELDIDWPVDVIRPEDIAETPDLLPYDVNNVKRRQYGALVENMVAIAAEMPEGDDRDALVALLASQMKKVLLNDQRDDITDERIYKDIYEMSEGRIRIDSGNCPLAEFNVVQPVGKKKKKK